jgi:predicted O-linked N-acetylglucosamine transferase (SPINDLY family)
MGLPVLSCVGNTFSARVAGSLLTAMGLKEMVTDNLADYENRANYYATNPKALLAIKQRLQKQRTTSALFNPANFARGLEQRYQNMWQEGTASN